MPRNSQTPESLHHGTYRKHSLCNSRGGMHMTNRDVVFVATRERVCISELLAGIARGAGSRGCECDSMRVAYAR